MKPLDSAYPPGSALAEAGMGTGGEEVSAPWLTLEPLYCREVWASVLHCRGEVDDGCEG